MGRALGCLLRHQPLRIEAGQRIASPGLLPDPLRWRRLPTGSGDSGAAELTRKDTATGELVQSGGWRRRRVTVNLWIPQIVEESAFTGGIHAAPQLIVRLLGKQSLGGCRMASLNRPLGHAPPRVLVIRISLQHLQQQALGLIQMPVPAPTHQQARQLHPRVLAIRISFNRLP